MATYGYKYMAVRWVRTSSGRQYLLESPAILGALWKGPAIRAHAAPEIGRLHGINVYKTLQQLVQGEPRLRNNTNCVVVKLRLFGKIIEYSRGFRAEKAIVDLILMPSETRYGIKTNLERRYHCDVQILTRLDDHASFGGCSDVSTIKLPKRWKYLS